jgi:hypothetical protein
MTVVCSIQVPLESAQEPSGLAGTAILPGIFRQSVVRSLPSRAAARREALDGCGRCGRLLGFATIERGEVSGLMIPPHEYTIACSGVFSNSRMLPGHSWSRRTDMARRETARALPLLLAATYRRGLPVPSGQAGIVYRSRRPIARCAVGVIQAARLHMMSSILAGGWRLGGCGGTLMRADSTVDRRYFVGRIALARMGRLPSHGEAERPAQPARPGAAESGDTTPDQRSREA